MIHLIITRDDKAGKKYIEGLVKRTALVTTVSKPIYIVRQEDITYMLLSPESIQPYGAWIMVDNAHFLGDLTIKETLEAMKLLCEYYTKCAHIFLDGVEVNINEL